MKSAIRLIDSSGQSWYGVWTTSTSSGDVYGKLTRSIADFRRHHPAYFGATTEADIARLEAQGTDDEFLAIKSVYRRIRYRARGRKGPHKSGLDWFIEYNAWPYDERPLVLSTSEVFYLAGRGRFLPLPATPQAREEMGRCASCNAMTYEDEVDDYSVVISPDASEVRHKDCEIAKTICACAFCGGPIHEVQAKAGRVHQHPVYKLGELNYIELAHARCAPEGWDQPVRPGSEPRHEYDEEDEWPPDSELSTD